MSPLRSFLLEENAFSQDTEVLKKPLPGEGQDERGKMAAEPPAGQWVAGGKLCSFGGSLGVERG